MYFVIYPNIIYPDTYCYRLKTSSLPSHLLDLFMSLVGLRGGGDTAAITCHIRHIAALIPTTGNVLGILERNEARKHLLNT